MAILSRTDRQTAALVDLLRALPEKQLVDVLDRIGASLDSHATSERASEVCGICGRYYPKCRALARDDHDFERPRQPGGGVPPPESVRAVLVEGSTSSDRT